ncbi:MAG: hypothetical protein Q8O00_04820 [Holophaga sp.]|nr:hypothetical protein [Holophaga sp.]
MHPVREREKSHQRFCAGDGVPACALFHKATNCDILLPRVLAGVELKRADLAQMAEGGFCLGCRTCVYRSALSGSSVVQRRIVPVRSDSDCPHG